MSRPEQAVFRLPVSALFIPVGLFVFATPLASASVWTVGLYLLPIYGLAYVLVTRTVADDRTITASTPISRRRIPWADLDGFEFQGQRWAIAVTLDGKRIRLPMVRPRDLRRLAEVSGGRLYLGEDASAAAEQADAESAALTTLKAGAHDEPATAPTTPGIAADDSLGAQPIPTAEAEIASAEAGETTVTEGAVVAAPTVATAASSDDTGQRSGAAE
ncbi:MAG: PH domain-containing protein [Nakamurella sp.]